MRLLGLILLLSFASIAAANANDKPFGLWLEELRAEARAAGVSDATIEAALSETKPIERVIELDRRQPESTKTLYEYLEGAVSQTRIDEGRAMMSEHANLLDKVEAEYGVDKSVIVALWGIETNYGGFTGNFSVVDSLATLAYDGRRSDYFRGELLNALKIIDAGHIAAAEMDGSWAGAMGQCQFMPTSFLRYAVDYDGDGKRDIWNTHADIFASIANYLKSEGWTHGEPIALPVSVPAGFDSKKHDIQFTQTLNQWRKDGVTLNDSSELPQGNTQVSVVMVGRDADAMPYLIYNNFNVILKWNRSRFFATAVDLLSEEIR